MARRYVLQLQHGVRHAVGLRKAEVERSLGTHRLGAGQLLQPLHARLRLLGLAGLGLEAVDERLQVRALGLLALEADLLLAQLLGAQALERAVVAGVELRPALVEVQGVGDHAIEKLAVVRNDQQRARVAAQPLFQPQHGIEVEMVGGLVEQQQLGRAHQGARQVQPSTPAAGEFLHRALVGFRRKAQPVHQPAGPGAGVIAMQLLDAVMGARHRLDVTALPGIRLVAQRAGQFLVAAHHIVDGRVRQRGGFLRHRGQAQPAGHVQLAGIAFQLPLQRGEQAGLAAAIAADHAQPPAALDDQVDVREQQPAAAAQGEVAKGDHAGNRSVPGASRTRSRT